MVNSKTNPIEKKVFYYHPQSLERTTQITKSKFKLLVNILSGEDIYAHIVSTSKSGRKNPNRSIEATFTDWEEVTNHQLTVNKMKSATSYLCWDSIEIHTLSEIQQRFYYVAKLKDAKWKELQDKKKNVYVYADSNSPRKHRLTQLAILDENEAETAAKRLNLV